MTKNSRRLIYLMLIVLLTMSYVAFAAPGDTFIVSDIEYTVIDATTVAVTDYNGSAANVTIPPSVSDGTDTYDVTIIGEHAFADCDSTEKITLPDTLQVIENDAFRDSDLLEEVRFDSATEMVVIDDQAFDGLTASFQYVTVPHEWSGDSMTEPNGVLRYMFDHRIDTGSAWMLFDFEEGPATCTLSLNNFTKGYNGDSTVIIPEGVTEISDDAFMFNSGFVNATEIQYVSFPSTLYTMGSNVFNDQAIDEMIFFNRDENFASDSFDGTTVTKTWTNEDSDVRDYVVANVVANNYATVYLKPVSAGRPNQILEGDTVDWTPYLSDNFETRSDFYIGQTISWTSDTPGIASVDSNTGEITGESPGTAFITATNSDGFWSSRQITVEPLVLSLDGTIDEDTGYSNSDNITNDTVITIPGTSNVPNSTVYLLIDGNVTIPPITSSTDGLGDFSLELNFGDPDYSFSEGTYALSARINNGAAGIESDDFDVTYDTTAPEPGVQFVDDMGIEIEYYNLASTTLRFAPENLTDVYEYEWILSDSAVIDSDTDDGPFVEITEGTMAGVEEGNVDVQLRAIDAAGNTSDWYLDTIVKDTILPDSPTVEIQDPWLNVDDEVLDFKVTGLEVDATYTYRIVILEDPNSPRDALTGAGSAEDVSVDTDGLFGDADGTVQLWVRQVDAAGNISDSPGADDVVKDTIPPSGYTVEFTNDYANIADPFGYFDVAGVEAGATGVYTITDGATDLTGACDADGSYSHDLSSLADGTITISIVITDEHENVGDVSDEDTLTKDTVAPVAPTVEIDDDYLNSFDEEVNFTASGLEVGADYKCVVHNRDEIPPLTTKITLNGVVALENETFSVDTDGTLIPEDGTIVVRVRQTDLAGNTGAYGRDEVMKDTDVPVLAGLTIDNPVYGMPRPVINAQHTLLDFTVTETNPEDSYEFFIMNGPDILALIDHIGSIDPGDEQPT